MVAVTDNISSAPHVKAAGARLAHLAGLADRTDATERSIKAAAEERLALVNRDIATLRPRVNLDDAVAAQYNALILERGRLAVVVGQAREVLGE